MNLEARTTGKGAWIDKQKPGHYAKDRALKVTICSALATLPLHRPNNRNRTTRQKVKPDDSNHHAAHGIT